MATVNAEDIARYTEEHSNLLESISRLDNAPSQLRETTALIKTLEEDLKLKKAQLEKLQKKRKMEQKDFDQLSGSSIRRFFVRLRAGKGGLVKRLEKEEMEYIQAAQAEHTATQAVQDLETEIKTAKDQNTEYAAQTAERTGLLRLLDNFYSSVFSGSTPDFPEEDAAEDALREADRLHEEAMARLHHEEQVFKILDQSNAAAVAAVLALRSANRAATFDTWGVADLWAEFAERDDLLRAQRAATQSSSYLQQARRLSPQIPNIQLPPVVQPEWLNVIFDNIFTDLAFQQQIQRSLNDLTGYQRVVGGQRELSISRIAALKQPVNEAAEHMRHCRRELTAVRREILTRLAEEKQDLPPVYMTQPAAEHSTLAVGPPVASRAGSSGEGEASSGPAPPPEYMRFDANPSRPNSGFGAQSPPAILTPMPEPTFSPPAGPPPERSVSPSRVPLPPASPVLSATSHSSSRPPSLYAPPSGPPPGRASLDVDANRRSSFASNNPFRSVS